MKPQVTLDHAGIAKALTSGDMRARVHAAAEQIADTVRADPHVGDADVVVDDYITDRAASAVTIRHPKGLRVEAKHGVLARAALAHGLDVTSKSKP